MKEPKKCGHCGSQRLRIEGIYNDSVYSLCESCRTGYFDATMQHDLN